jgi:hypothetical protein
MSDDVLHLHSRSAAVEVMEQQQQQLRDSSLYFDDIASSLWHQQQHDHPERSIREGGGGGVPLVFQLLKQLEDASCDPHGLRHSPHCHCDHEDFQQSVWLAFSLLHCPLLHLS